MELGEFSGDDDGAVSKDGFDVVERFEDAVGGFVEDKSGFDGAPVFEGFATLPLLGGEEAGVAEGVGGEAGAGQGGEHGGSAGNGHDGNAGFEGGLDDAVAGVGDQRRAGVGDDSDGLPA